MRVSSGFVSALVGTAITILSWYGPWAWPAWPALTAIRLLFGTRVAFAELSYGIRAAVVVGLIVLLLAGTIIWPFPFSHIIPTLVAMLVSFAYLEEDGVLLCISLAAALASFAITAATVWATVRATGLLEKLL